MLRQSFLLTVVTIHQVMSQKYGPSVVTTQGEPWPMPYKRSLHGGFKLIHPQAVIYRYNHNHPILVDAVARYRNIIIKECEIGYRSIKHQQTDNDNIYNDPDYKGDINIITFNVPLQEETRPYLNMNESYTLTANSGQIVIDAGSIWGALRALETLSQLLKPSGKKMSMIIQLQTIYDEPKLSHRGLMLDTSRHYLPVSDILMTLDAMSYNKLNVFHWHIVDDQTFPYKGKKYPELAEKGTWHPEFLYTFNDVKSIIEYARLRGIRVISEFDSPGHVASWGQSHPELLTTCYDTTGKPDGKLGPINPINPNIWEFLNTFFDEVFELFYDSFVHLGGDEVYFECWESNPDITTYMNDKNMANDFTRLENEYIQKLLKIPESHKKSAIVWHEVFDNGVTLTPSTAVHVWTGEWRKKLQNVTEAGHPVLLSACWYLDHVAGGGDWEKYYDCDPLDFVGSDSVRHLMLGGEACMWGEFVDRTNIHQRVWPRASAVAERLWSHANETVAVAAQRLEEHTCRMNRRDIPAQPPNGPSFCYT